MKWRIKNRDNKGAKKKITSAMQLVIIVSVIAVPAACLLIGYNFYAIQIINRDVAQSLRNSIYLYQNDFEERLSRIEITMSEYWANDSDHIGLKYKMSTLAAHTSLYSIINKYKMQMSSEDLIVGMYIYSSENNTLRSYLSFDEGGYEVRNAMGEKAREVAENPEKYSKTYWIPTKINNKYFMLRIMGDSSAATICIVDPDRATKPQDSPESDNSFLIYSDESGVPLTSTDFVYSNEIEIQTGLDQHYVSGKSPKYFIVQTFSPYTSLYFVYLKPYHGRLFFMDRVQVIFLSISLLIFFLIPVTYLLFRSLYMRPLEKMISTMQSIKSGNLESRIDKNQRILEFEQMSLVFNSMMDEIKHLKIETYEKELLYQKTKRQYLMIQIKPHFFLNYLKNLYALAQKKEYERIQTVVLLMSDHFRYIFRDSMELVPLETELHHAKNYISMQQNIMLRSVKYNEEIESSCRHIKIPTFCIQTFVENCFKHSHIETQDLIISVKVSLLESEDGDCIDISVYNNGISIPQDKLDQLNGELNFEYDCGHIGIQNIRHRLFLIYENSAGFACMNVDEGVVFELVIPITNE